METVGFKWIIICESYRKNSSLFPDLMIVMKKGDKLYYVLFKTFGLLAKGLGESI
jgi:hypothetical protein